MYKYTIEHTIAIYGRIRVAPLQLYKKHRSQIKEENTQTRTRYSSTFILIPHKYYPRLKHNNTREMC